MKTRTFYFFFFNNRDIHARFWTERKRFDFIEVLFHGKWLFRVPLQSEINVDVCDTKRENLCILFNFRLAIHVE